MGFCTQTGTHTHTHTLTHTISVQWLHGFPSLQGYYICLSPGILSCIKHDVLSRWGVLLLLLLLFISLHHVVLWSILHLNGLMLYSTEMLGASQLIKILTLFCHNSRTALEACKIPMIVIQDGQLTSWSNMVIRCRVCWGEVLNYAFLIPGHQVWSTAVGFVNLCPHLIFCCICPILNFSHTREG